MYYAIILLCMTIVSANMSFAASLLEEKIVTPPSSTDAPNVIIVPVVPDIPVPVEPVVPVVPEKAPVVIAPVRPVTPVPTPAPAHEQAPRKDTAPSSPGLTPAQFIPLVDLETQKKADEQKPKTPAAKPEKPKQIEQARKNTPQKGDPFHIPSEAAKNDDLSFLEGCWRGTRPEYATKRTVTERFCFDKNGKGKRNIIDPALAGECYGATQGSFDAQGRLIVTSEQGYCTKGQRWGAAEMICHGEGPSTPCYWVFKDAGGGTQSYQIPFVKE